MKIGYGRITRTTQSAELQIAALKQAGCKQVYIDDASGVKTSGQELAKCLQKLKSGDVLTIWKLDRLGHSLRDLVLLLDNLKKKEVAFQSIEEAIDTTTPTGHAMWDIIGILAQLQRSQVQERTQSGRKAAIARGVKMGRKRSLSPRQIKAARHQLAAGKHARVVAKFYGTSLATLYRALNYEKYAAE